MLLSLELHRQMQKRNQSFDSNLMEMDFLFGDSLELDNFDAQNRIDHSRIFADPLGFTIDIAKTDDKRPLCGSICYHTISEAFFQIVC